MQVILDQEAFRLEIEGPTAFGPDLVLLDGDDDLTAGHDWSSVGYCVHPYLDPACRAAIVERAEGCVRDALRDAGAHDLSGFSLDRYHRFVDRPGRPDHQDVVSSTRRFLPLDWLPVEARVLEEAASRVCGVSLTLVNPVRNEPVFLLRIVRPGCQDYNPLHRDAWLDFLRHGLNVYVPLVGSNSRSSLPVVPGSHRWSESSVERTPEGAVLGGKSYHVPAVSDCRHPLELVRPDPGVGEALFFSPYLLHGLGINRNQDVTRVSLELRFYRADGPDLGHRR